MDTHSTSNSERLTMMPSDPEYQKHQVFTELAGMIEFYERLAHSTFLWTTLGTNAFANIDSYVFSSIQGTLSSIRMILCDGRINDAYALLRKYYDSAVINVYSNLYLEDKCSIENFIVAEIDGWLKGKKQLPDYQTMFKYIRACTRIGPITTVLSVDDRYKKLRDRCNDHTHYNFYQNVLLNDNQICLRNRGKALEDFACDVRDVFILHFAYLFCAKQNYMMSSDYVDALECGMTPDDDSQYWVAPFIQEVFDNVVKTNRHDVAAVIKNHTSMHLS